MVDRSENITLTYYRLDGTENTLEVKWPLSGVIQHECDHLDGILYPMRMHDFRLFGFAEEVKRNPDLFREKNNQK